MTISSPAAFASILKQSPSKTGGLVAALMGHRSTSIDTNSSRITTASGILVNVPPATMDVQANSGPKKGRTCLRAPATKVSLPRAARISRPTTPPSFNLAAIQLLTHSFFRSLIPTVNCCTSSWYPIHCTTQPPDTFFQLIGNSNRSSTKNQYRIFAPEPPAGSCQPPIISEQ